MHSFCGYVDDHFFANNRPPIEAIFSSCKALSLKLGTCWISNEAEEGSMQVTEEGNEQAAQPERKSSNLHLKFVNTDWEWIHKMGKESAGKYKSLRLDFIDANEEEHKQEKKEGPK